MKKLITLFLLLASSQVSAFWGLNNGNTNSFFDNLFNGASEGEYSVSMTFKGKTRGDGQLDGRQYGYGYGNAYNRYDNYTGKTANLANGFGMFDGLSEGEFTFKMHFKAKGNGHADSRFANRGYANSYGSYGYNGYYNPAYAPYVPLTVPPARPLASIE